MSAMFSWLASHHSPTSRPRSHQTERDESHERNEDGSGQGLGPTRSRSISMSRNGSPHQMEVKRKVSSGNEIGSHVDPARNGGDRDELEYDDEHDHDHDQDGHDDQNDIVDVNDEYFTPDHSSSFPRSRTTTDSYLAEDRRASRDQSQLRMGSQAQPRSQAAPRVSMPPPSSSSYASQHSLSHYANGPSLGVEHSGGSKPRRSYRSSTTLANDDSRGGYQTSHAGPSSSSSAVLRRIRTDHDRYPRPSASPAPAPAATAAASSSSSSSSSPSITQELHRMTQLLISSDTLARETKRESEKRLERIEDSLEARMTVMNDLLGEVRDLLEGERQGREEIMVRFDLVLGRLDMLEERLQGVNTHTRRGGGSDSRSARHNAATRRQNHDEDEESRDSRDNSVSGYSTACEAAANAENDRDLGFAYQSSSPPASVHRQKHTQLQPLTRSRAPSASQRQLRNRHPDQPDRERQSSSAVVNTFLDFVYNNDTALADVNHQNDAAAEVEMHSPHLNGSDANTYDANEGFGRQGLDIQQDTGIEFDSQGHGDLPGGLFIDIVGDEFQPADMDVNMNMNMDVDGDMDLDTPLPTATLLSMDLSSAAGVDPRDIMRPPKTLTPAPVLVVPETTAKSKSRGQSNGMDKNSSNHKRLRSASDKEAPKVAREKRKSAAVQEHRHISGVHVNESDDDDSRPPRSKRTKRKESTPPLAHSSGDDSVTESSSDSGSDREEIDDDGKRSKKPPARLPFPSRLPAPGKATANDDRTISTTAADDQQHRDPHIPKPSTPDVKEDTDRRRRSRRKSTIALTTAKKQEPKGQSPVSIGSSESSYTASKKKKRYSHGYGSKYTRAGTARVRKFRGAVRLAQKCLAPSDGNKKTEAEWPRKGPNTARGRLEEIICDVCKGRCHWSCAGIPEEKDMTKETWICPDCTYRIEEDEIDRELIDTVQQIKCIRFNCILREKRALDHEEGEEAMYFVERIVGRRKNTKIDPKTGDPSYEYLVKWDGYDMEECTWEPSSNLAPHFTRLYEAFLRKVKVTHSNLEAAVCVLPEAKQCWDEVSGKSKTARSPSQSGDGSEGEGRSGSQSEGEDEAEGLAQNSIKRGQGHEKDVDGDREEAEVDELEAESADQLLSSPEKKVEREASDQPERHGPVSSGSLEENDVDVVVGEGQGPGRGDDGIDENGDEPEEELEDEHEFEVDVE
ncbi:hypothetical protein IAU59_005828 [Kwoniella sp. CBS 9459]